MDAATSVSVAGIGTGYEVPTFSLAYSVILCGEKFAIFTSNGQSGRTRATPLATTTFFLSHSICRLSTIRRPWWLQVTGTNCSEPGSSTTVRVTLTASKSDRDFLPKIFFSGSSCSIGADASLLRIGAIPPSASSTQRFRGWIASMCRSMYVQPSRISAPRFRTTANGTLAV